MGLLTKDDVTQHSLTNNSSSAAPLSNEVQSYQKQLDNLTQTINGLLEGLDNVAKVSNIAKDSQEKLYSAHHKVRNQYIVYCYIVYYYFPLFYFIL